MRDLVTAALEVVGILSCAAGAASAVAGLNTAGGVAVGGLVTLAGSALVSLRAPAVVDDDQIDAL